jgi:hypothetical protein
MQDPVSKTFKNTLGVVLPYAEWVMDGYNNQSGMKPA